jgi:hypothetical protein
LLLLSWGYIVTYIKFLTIYHSWSSTLHHSALNPLSSFTDLIFLLTYIFIEYLRHSYLPISFPYTLPIPLLLPLKTNHFLHSYSLFLFKKWHFSLSLFHCNISMHIWIITQIGSSPLLFFFLPYSFLWWFPQV